MRHFTKIISRFDRTRELDRLTKLCLCVSTLVVAACAHPQTARPDATVQLPEAFVAASRPDAGAIADQWWTRFGDETLNAYVEKAVRDNPAIGQAIARVAQARAQAQISGADQLPQVGVGLSASKQSQSLASLGIALPGGDQTLNETNFDIENYQLTGSVSWELDLWGKLSAQSAAARAQFLANQSELRAVRQAIAAQTARSYFAHIEASQRLTLSQSIVETLAETERQMGNRVDYGKAAPDELLLATSALRSAEAALAQDKQILARASRQLDILLREYPDGEVNVAQALPQVPAVPSVGLPAELLARRPDIASAQSMLDAAGYRLIAAEHSFLPSIELTGSAGTSSTSVSNLLNPDFLIWSIAGQILQPIFQGGRLRAQAQLREGERDEMLEGFADTVLTALSEVETALALEDHLARQEVAVTAAEAAAQQATRIATNRYNAGSDPFLTILESQRRSFDASRALLTVRKARIDNRIALHLALGGGF